MIEDMGIAGDAKSLVLILNNVDNGNAPKLPAGGRGAAEKNEAKGTLGGEFPPDLSFQNGGWKLAGEFFPPTALFPEGRPRRRKRFTEFTGWKAPLAAGRIREALFLIMF